MEMNYEKLYQDNLDFACDTLYSQMQKDKAYTEYLDQTGRQSSLESLKSYIDNEAGNRLKEFQNVNGNDAKGNSKKEAWKIISYFRRENPYLSENKAFQKFNLLTPSEKQQMETFIANPANQKELENIFKINFSADFCANTYHRSRINQEFNKLQGFETSEFIPELDKGNCTKGLTLALCRNLNKHGFFSSELPRDKESWAHPVGMYQLVNKTIGRPDDVPPNISLGDYLQSHEAEKGTIFIINGHHAMLYGGAKNEKGEPLCHAFNPEAVDYPLKLDKQVYGIDIPAFVKQKCGEKAPQVIDQFVADVKKDIEAINFAQIFKQRLTEIQAAPKQQFNVAEHLAYCKEKVSARQHPIEITQENKGRLTYVPQKNITFQSVLKNKNQNS